MVCNVGQGWLDPFGRYDAPGQDRARFNRYHHHPLAFDMPMRHAISNSKFGREPVRSSGRRRLQVGDPRWLPDPGIIPDPGSVGVPTHEGPGETIPRRTSVRCGRLETAQREIQVSAQPFKGACRRGGREAEPG